MQLLSALQLCKTNFIYIFWFKQNDDYSGQNGRAQDDESGERYRINSLVFRPESAPTVLDMSPECSLSGPPSARNSDFNDAPPDDEGHHYHGEDLNGKQESLKTDLSLAWLYSGNFS